MSASSPALHPIEKTLLKALSNNYLRSAEKLAELTGLEIDQVRRGIEWLKFKNFISVSESTNSRAHLASEGEAAAAYGLPERRLMKAVKEGNNTVAEVLASGAIKNEEVNAAIAGARRNQWVQLVEGKMVATAQAANQSPGAILLVNLKGGTDTAKLSDEEKRVLEQLKKRPNYIIVRE